MFRTITIKPTHLAMGVLLAFGLVLIAGIVHDLYVYSQPAPKLDHKIWRLDVDMEQSVFTGMSVILIAFCSCLLLLCGFVRTGQKHGWQWFALALIFAGLAADEFLSLHETASAYLGDKFDLGGAFGFAWVLPALVLVVGGFVSAVPFLRVQTGKIRAGMLIAGTLFVLGAVGMEMLASLYIESWGTMQTIGYRFLVTAEEGLEALGMTVFMWTLLEHLRGATVVIEPSGGFSVKAPA
jgi:hypothetical protein